MSKDKNVVVIGQPQSISPVKDIAREVDKFIARLPSQFSQVHN